MKGIEVYPPRVLERFFDPRGAGSLSSGPGVVVARVGERRLGAEVELSIEIREERVAAARFRAYGCPYLIAAASELTERIPGQTLSALLSWSWRRQAERLEVPTERFGRLLMLEDAVRACHAAAARKVGDP